ncbi:hypothetical protein PVAP13_6NG016260 [Panicum virgatum]|uniref:Reverse transcriptase domain-containing protein n=1 Tax=Panicum virgatum TaxID=38727 RepID=A0A8T0QTE8_PANVG|nr:hypothetical protein PVAP13_6NG016260 [Panicum virgatum]
MDEVTRDIQGDIPLCMLFADDVVLDDESRIVVNRKLELWRRTLESKRQLSIAEMQMLQWFCGHTRRDRVRNEVIRDRVGVAPIEEKLIQHRLRWFEHVQWRPPEAPMRSGVLKRVDNVKRGRGRPKLTWDELVKRDLKEWNISKEIALDRSAWRLAINVPEPL